MNVSGVYIATTLMFFWLVATKGGHIQPVARNEEPLIATCVFSKEAMSDYWRFSSHVFEPTFTASSLDGQVLLIFYSFEVVGERTCLHNVFF
ncbi:unnamed protein product [Ixodes pacificus]